MIIRAYRIRGHLEADLDPLGLEEMLPHPELATRPTASPRPTSTGRSSSTTCSASRPRRLREILAIAASAPTAAPSARSTCTSPTPSRRPGSGADRGLRQGDQLHPRRASRAILEQADRGRGLREVPARKYPGTKRFWLDGGEALIPVLEQIIERGGALGVEEIVIGMPHRGRLNVLANILDKPYEVIFSEFEGGSFKPEERRGRRRRQVPPRLLGRPRVRRQHASTSR